MKDDSSRDAAREDLHELDDEIEILEVVGVDDDETPPAADVEPPQEDLRDADEVVLSFGDPESAPAPMVDDAGDGTEPTGSDRERLIRLQADFENLRKRIDRERDDYHRHATASLVLRLLPTIDNFERALAGETVAETYDPFRDGVSLIYRQMLEELRREGLRPVDAVGHPFDPERHEAVATDATSSEPPNTVLEEFQRGYFFGDRLLRPALVRVSVDAAHPELVAEDSEDADG
jgi:molecular chaperone GrpE